MQKLVIEDDEGRTTVVPLLRDEISIGRKDGNTIRLTERNVSRRHARLVRQNSVLVVEDLNSYNGVRVNGVRIQSRTHLKEGDRIQIGDYMLALRADVQEPLGPPKIEVADAQLVGPPPAPLEGPVTEQIRLAPAPAQKPAVPEMPAPPAPIAAPATAPPAPVAAPPPAPAPSAAAPAPPPASAPAAAPARVEVPPVPARPVAATTALRPAARRSRAPLIAVGAAFVVALAMFKLLGGKESPEGSPKPPEVAEPTPSPSPPPAPAPPPVVGPGPDAIARVEAAEKAEDWDLVIALCKPMLAQDPRDATCAARKARAEVERGAKAAYAAFGQAAAKKDYEGAVARWSEIPPGSVYEARGQAEYGKVRDAYVRDVQARVADAVKASRCQEARRLRDSLAVVDESLARGELECREPVAAATPPAPKPRPAPPAPRPAGEAFDPEKLNEILTEAENAYVASDHSTAISTARRALKLQPGNTKAWRIIGVSSCSLKDRGTALNAYKRLNENNRNLLKYACQRNGVTLP